jgi:Tfp pilus assembly protein PilO
MPRSTGERLWWIVGGLGAFLLVLVGWFFLISPQRGRTSGIEDRVGAARHQNLVLQARINSLRTQNADLAKYQAKLRRAQLALPNQSGASDFLRTLQKIGNDTSTQLAQWNFGAPVAINMTPTTGATTPTPAATTSAAPAAGGVPKPAPGVYAVPITVSVTGSPTALGQFLQQLQAAQPRSVLITKLVEGAGAATQAKTPGTSLQLAMQAFVDTAEAPVPTGATPTATPTATP